MCRSHIITKSFLRGRYKNKISLMLFPNQSDFRIWDRKQTHLKTIFFSKILILFQNFWFFSKQFFLSISTKKTGSAGQLNIESSNSGLSQCMMNVYCILKIALTSTDCLWLFKTSCFAASDPILLAFQL